MKVVPDRIVPLGFGKYVRADRIVGLIPIEDERGPGHRTLVYVEGLPEPVTAGRTEATILRDMVGTESGSVELLRSPVAPSRDPESPKESEHALAETASTATSVIIVRFIEGDLPSEGTAFPRVIRVPDGRGFGWEDPE